jgi:glycerophosphoryl diester phosphodiesterase
MAVQTEAAQDSERTQGADGERARVERESGAPTGHVLVYAHRGARGHAPENTLLAFQLAFALGADGIECDVQRSADGALVVIHDDTLDRTTNGKGRVAAWDLAALRALDAGQGQRIPTLSEVLDLACDSGRQVNLEVKAATAVEALATAETLKPALARLDEDQRCRVLVSSFELPAVGWLKRELPWLRVATLHGGRAWRRRDLLAPALEMGAEAVHPSVRLASPELVARAHTHGLLINVYTANRIATLRRLLGWGVDGVFTDYPARAIILRTLAMANADPASMPGRDEDTID